MVRYDSRHPLTFYNSPFSRSVEQLRGEGKVLPSDKLAQVYVMELLAWILQSISHVTCK